jgi:PAS domain S-box-containing protein
VKNSNYQLYGDKELSERIFFKAPIGIYIAQDGKFRFVNPAFLKIAGYQKDELLGADSLKLVFPEDRDRVRKNVLEMLKGGNPSPYLFRAVAKNGDLSWGIETVTSVQYEGRRAILGYFMDNSKLKQAEEENLRLQAELHQTHRVETIGTLARGIAHDFKNILHGIIGHAEIALYHQVKENDPVRESLNGVLKGAERAVDLVEEILVFSRKKKQEPTEFTLTSVINECTTLLRAALPSTIEIKQDIISKNNSMSGDPNEIHQVLMNLCTNAAHAMKENGGQLGISLERIELKALPDENYHDLLPGKYVKLSVSDTGPGIDPEISTQIFDPYFTTKEVGEGSGLGLAIAKRIIKKHGGEIILKTELKKGSVFSVFLPYSG